MKLLVDIGNTTLSTSLWKNDKLYKIKNIQNHKLSLILSEYNKISVSLIIISSVISQKNTMLIKEKLRKVFNCEIKQIKSSENLLGVTNGYNIPRKLGADRWVTIVASHISFRKPLIIVDCGTAISIDCVNKNGRHLGGYILSGYNGYAQAFANAHNLKNIKLKSSNIYNKKSLPKKTGDAITSGYVLMVASAIEKIYDDMLYKFKDKPALIMTGSYAKQILPYVSISVIYERYLVLKSLGIISNKV